ncbi:MAG: rhomboid family intramembrane serine protease [Parvibaculales bacterium]
MFFLPLRDDNPTRSRPLIAYILLAACILVFFWQISLGSAQQQAVLAYGMIPARLFGSEAAYGMPSLIPAWMTTISSMFLHGGFMHLAGNMLYLWIFGDNVEDSIGRRNFVIFYVLCGIAAALSQAMVDPSSPIPMIGASGAIAGVLGAYLLLHPRANIRCIIGFFIFFRLINVPAFLVLGGWIGLQFMSLGQIDSNVAYVAHIGGFIAGMLLIPFFKKKHVKLFDKPHSRAFAVSPVSTGGHIPQIGKKRRKTPWDK